MERNKKIIKASIYGIIVNILLVIFKAIVGLIANSIAIVLDAVNNLTDAISSIITIIGTKLSSKKPDKKHPFGHGRIEYFSSVIIAIIVLIAGVVFAKESIEKIISPTLADYSFATLIVITAAIFVKFFFGTYLKKQGKTLNSGSLTASGIDSISDSIISLSTFIAALISIIWKISLEGYLGVIISILIIKSAIIILKETIDQMIGTRADSELTNKLKEKISSYQGVFGVYDLILHNYGMNKIIATAHIQVKDEMNAREIHRLTRKISFDIFNEYGIILTLGIYASNEEEEYKEIQEYLKRILEEYETILQIHGFYVDEQDKNISFDLIFSFDEKNPEAIIEKIKTKLKEKYSKYEYNVIIDTDFTD